MSDELVDGGGRNWIPEEEMAAIIYAVFKDDVSLEVSDKKTPNPICWPISDLWRYVRKEPELVDSGSIDINHLESCGRCASFVLRLREVYRKPLPVVVSDRSNDTFRFEIPALAAADDLVVSAARELGTMNLKRTSMRNDLVLELRDGEGDLTGDLFTSPAGLPTPDYGCLVRLQKTDGFRNIFLFANATGVFSEMYPVDVEGGIEVVARRVERTDLDAQIVVVLEHSRKLLRDPRWARFYDEWLATESSGE